MPIMFPWIRDVRVSWLQLWIQISRVRMHHTCLLSLANVFTDRKTSIYDPRMPSFSSPSLVCHGRAGCKCAMGEEQELDRTLTIFITCLFVNEAPMIWRCEATDSTRHGNKALITLQPSIRLQRCIVGSTRNTCVIGRTKSHASPLFSMAHLVTLQACSATGRDLNDANEATPKQEDRHP